MLSHDAFLVVSELRRAGGKMAFRELEKRLSGRLTDGIVHVWENLLDTGLASEQLDEALKLHSALKLTTQKKTFKLTFCSLHENSDVQQLHVADVVRQAIDRRNFSAPYQAVVQNIYPRRTDAEKYASGLSAADRGDFWTMYMEADEETRKNLDRDISRAVTRSR